MDGLRFLFVKDMDVPTYVEYGVADCGDRRPRRAAGAGQPTCYEPLDLGFGALPAGGRASAWRGPTRTSASTVRVATKYPRVAAAHFLSRGCRSRW